MKKSHPCLSARITLSENPVGRESRGLWSEVWSNRVIDEKYRLEEERLLFKLSTNDKSTWFWKF